jgi:hypothetical protein
MALINTTTTGIQGTTIFADGTGSLTIQQNGATLGVFGNQPAFSVYQGTQQSLSDTTYTKIAFTVKTFDTANCFDNTTNYRFTPTVAGYYQINLTVYGIATSMTYIQTAIYKNGTNYCNTLIPAQQSTNAGGMVSSLVYLNGTTDYVEGYVSMGASSGRQVGSTGATNLVQMSGCLIKAV